MSLRRIGVGLVALTGLALGTKHVAARRRALSEVPAELRRPMLHVPLNITNTLTLAVVRRLTRTLDPPLRGEVRAERRTTTTTPAVDVVVYEHPERSTPSGALLWIHGGGTILGTPELSHPWCSQVADELGTLVVSVDFRLAPENPFPAGLDDCYEALRWLHDNATDLGVDPARIAVGGDSAGGGMAAALAQRAHDDGLPVCFQLLVYPMLDDRTTLRDDHERRGTFTWTPASNHFAWSAYLGRTPQEREDRPYAAASRRADLTGLAPAWIGVGDLDLFWSEDIDYAHRLRRAGVACELRVEPGMYHGADILVETSPAMTAFQTSKLDALRRALTTD